MNVRRIPAASIGLTSRCQRSDVVGHKLSSRVREDQLRRYLDPGRLGQFLVVFVSFPKRNRWSMSDAGEPRGHTVKKRKH